MSQPAYVRSARASRMPSRSRTPAPSSVNSRSRMADPKPATEASRRPPRTTGSTSLRWTWLTRSPYVRSAATGSPPPTVKWPDVEAQRQDVGGDRMPRSRADLVRRFDVRPGVRMERDPGAHGADLGRDRLEELDGRRPAGIGQARRGRVGCPAGERVTVRRAVEGDAQDLPATGGQEPDPLADLVERGGRRPVDRGRDGGIHLGEAKVALGEERAELVALGKSEAQLAAVVAGPGDVVEDRRRRSSRGAARRCRRCSRGSARSRSMRR